MHYNHCHRATAHLELSIYYCCKCSCEQHESVWGAEVQLVLHILDLTTTFDAPHYFTPLVYSLCYTPNRGWVDLRAGLDNLEGEKSLSLARN